MDNVTVTDVIEHFGGLTATASALGVTKAAIWQWREAGAIPEARTFQIELVSKGRFKAGKLPTRKTAA